jgi:hypothetical protein
VASGASGTHWRAVGAHFWGTGGAQLLSLSGRSLADILLLGSILQVFRGWNLMNAWSGGERKRLGEDGEGLPCRAGTFKVIALPVKGLL